ncbi:MAG: Arc family DNA-binding protein [Rhodocyclaceae bacterium]
MSVSFSVKNIPEALAERLRVRAERNHRSLQGELLAILEAAANEVLPTRVELSLNSGQNQGSPARVKVVVASVMQPTAEYRYPLNALR